MTTDERLRQQVRQAVQQHYEMQEAEQQRLKNKSKKGAWNWIKREVLFAEELTNWELFVTFTKVVIAIPFIIAGTWLLFATLYALTGVR